MGIDAGPVHGFLVGGELLLPQHRLVREQDVDVVGPGDRGERQDVDLIVPQGGLIDLRLDAQDRESEALLVRGREVGFLPRGPIPFIFPLLSQLPQNAQAPPELKLSPLEGRRVLLVEKPGQSTAISFGHPIDVHRGSREFYALWLANSWLGEHRNSVSHLYQVIREARGMNYGDYSYIEAFPQGGFRQFPPSHVGRRQQLFEVWIRTLPNEQAQFALRAAVRELERLVWDAVYALQKAGLDDEAGRLRRALTRSG